MIDVNLTGMFLCAREAIRAFKRQGIDRTVSYACGKLIFMSSVHDIIPWEGHANYAAAKGGLMLLMKSLAQEVAHLRIRVNAISPGAIRTPMNVEKLTYTGNLRVHPAQADTRRNGSANPKTWPVRQCGWPPTIGLRARDDHLHRRRDDAVPGFYRSWVKQEQFVKLTAFVLTAAILSTTAGAATITVTITGTTGEIRVGEGPIFGHRSYTLIPAGDPFVADLYL